VYASPSEKDPKEEEEKEVKRKNMFNFEGGGTMKPFGSISLKIGIVWR